MAHPVHVGRCLGSALILSCLCSAEIRDEGSPGFLQMDLSLVGPSQQPVQQPSTAVDRSSVGFFLWHADAHVDPFYTSVPRNEENGPTRLVRFKGRNGGIMDCKPSWS